MQRRRFMLVATLATTVVTALAGSAAAAPDRGQAVTLNLVAYSTPRPVLTRLHGIAHITGGGIIDNVPRVLPDGLAARVEAGSWRVPPLFTLIQEKGAVSDDDMYHTFNMGIGIVIAVAAGDADGVMRDVPALRRVGAVTRQADERRVVIE